MAHYRVRMVRLLSYRQNLQLVDPACADLLIQGLLFSQLKQVSDELARDLLR